MDAPPRSRSVHDPPIGTLGYPLGDEIVIEGIGSGEPALRNPFVVHRAAGRTLAAAALLAVRGESSPIEPDKPRTLLGFESVEWLGCPPGVEAFVPPAERVRLGDWRGVRTFVVSGPPGEMGMTAMPAPRPPSPLAEPWGRLGHIAGTLLATTGSVATVCGRRDYCVETVEGKPLGAQVRLELGAAAPEDDGLVLVDGYEVAWYGRGGWKFGFRALRVRPKN